MRTLVIDGDIVAYQLSCEGQTTFEWTPGEVTIDTNEEQAFRAVDSWLERIRDVLNAQNVAVALSDPSRRYWRHDIYPQYKAHRTHGTPPVLLPKVKAYMREKYNAWVRPNLEGDDIIGILATHPRLLPGEKVIVSGDKDLNTIPGLHYNPRKAYEGEYMVTAEEAVYNHMYQTLTGDTCDGFPGCPGIGPVKAKKILNSAEEAWTQVESYALAGTPLISVYWERIVEAFRAKGMTEADALVQARIARICQWTDYDYKTKEVKLWTPTLGHSTPT